MAHTKPTERPDPCVIVIFGASGDLTHRKLIPALYELHEQGLLPEQTCVLGIARTEMSDDDFREKLVESARDHAQGFEEARWERFAQRIHYHPGDASEMDAYPGIAKRIEELTALHKLPASPFGQGNILFYLSVAPNLYKPIIQCVGGSGLVPEGKRWCAINRDMMTWQRIVVEKPFGEDLASTSSLNRALGRVFDEESIFRIDHYLGKELVQNILVMRFANTIFEPVWNRQHIDHVQLTANETLGVGSRAANFYDGAGAMRDMIQSHLVQVMSLVAMEPPSMHDAEGMSRERIKVFESARPAPGDLAHEIAAFGRYGPGPGDEPAYVDEKGVDPARKTETFCAMRVDIDNARWAGVPFYLRSGKKMARKLTEIVVQFKPPPTWLYRDVPLFDIGERRPPNRIIINIAPDDGVSLRFEAKVPGPTVRIDSVKMDMDYSETFDAKPVEAYGPLLLDAMRGDRMLYKHRDEVEGAWRICQPLLDSARLREQIQEYAPGTWGPRSSDELLARDGRVWHNPVTHEKR